MTPAKQSATDQLLDDLVESQHLISYKAAYPLLIGPTPDPFCSNHGGAVGRFAETSKVVTVGGLRIRLDALVVRSKEEVPSAEHFDGKPYTVQQWHSVFASWPVRRP